MINTLIIIIEQVFLYVPLVCGAYISIALMKVPDLSIEAAYVFGAIAGSKVISLLGGVTSYGLACGIIGIGLFGGMCVGFVSSMLTQYAHLPHLLSSILTIGLFHGINQLVLNAGYISTSQLSTVLDVFHSLQSYSELVVLATIACVITGAGIFFFRTQLGYAFAIYGNNPRFFEQYDISGRFVFIAGILISNALAGLTGTLIAQKTGFADINMGFGIALFCITSLVVGKQVMYKYRAFPVIIPVVGIFLYVMLQQVLLKSGMNLKYFTMIQSFIIVCILVMRSYQTSGTRDQGIDHLGV